MKIGEVWWEKRCEILERNKINYQSYVNHGIDDGLWNQQWSAVRIVGFNEELDFVKINYLHRPIKGDEFGYKQFLKCFEKAWEYEDGGGKEYLGFENYYNRA